MHCTLGAQESSCTDTNSLTSCDKIGELGLTSVDTSIYMAPDSLPAEPKTKGSQPSLQEAETEATPKGLPTKPV